MPADPTPAALDALLRMCEQFLPTDHDGALAATLAPRLAAIVRVLRERVTAARAVIRRLPRQEEAGKYCESCGEKSSWDAWEQAEKTLDPSGLACQKWCPTPTAYMEMAAIDTALARAEAIARGEE